MTRLESRFLVTRTRLESRWKHCWLDSSHVSHRMTRIESESFFYKISEPLMGKSSSVARGNHVDLVWFLKYSFLGTRITWLCLSVLTDASVSSSCWIFFKDIMFLKRYGRILSWVFAEGQNCFLPHLDIGTKNHTMLENLKSASRFRLNSCKKLYLPVWHSHCTKASFAVLVWCSDEFAELHSCPLLHLQTHVAKLASALFYCFS